MNRAGNPLAKWSVAHRIVSPCSQYELVAAFMNADQSPYSSGSGPPSYHEGSATGLRFFTPYAGNEASWRLFRSTHVITVDTRCR